MRCEQSLEPPGLEVGGVEVLARREHPGVLFPGQQVHIPGLLVEHIGLVLLQLLSGFLREVVLGPDCIDQGQVLGLDLLQVQGVVECLIDQTQGSYEDEVAGLMVEDVFVDAALGRSLAIGEVLVSEGLRDDVGESVVVDFGDGDQLGGRDTEVVVVVVVLPLPDAVDVVGAGGEVDGQVQVPGLVGEVGADEE